MRSMDAIVRSAGPATDDSSARGADPLRGSAGKPDAALRIAAVNRLVMLQERGELTGEHLRLVSTYLGVHRRTVERWISRARIQGPAATAGRERFILTQDLRVRLAYWRGNASALHRELVAEAREKGTDPPSLPTLLRAIRRDLSPGDRAGLRLGEPARRTYDVYLARPAVHRNEVWESDHVQVPVEVDVGGNLRKPWVTWFIDCGTNVIPGFAATPGYPSRESILAALRSALLREDPYGPFGGLPTRVRIDRGRDFLSKTVASALGSFAVAVNDLPAYRPHLKGTVEGLNRSAERMFFAELPRYTHAPVLANRKYADPDQPAITWEAFMLRLFAWVRTWNFEHVIDDSAGCTPRQLWVDDLTPIEDVTREAVWEFTLEGTGKDHVITNKGVQWKRRHYIDDWMNGIVGTPVRIRYMPHHDHEVEVYHARTGKWVRLHEGAS